METNKIATIHSVYGDAQDIVSRLSDILSILKFPISDKNIDEKEIFYHLRRVVDKCDNIASELEKVFTIELPKE